MRIRYVVAVVAALLVLAGCASLELPEQENAQQSLVVGYLDMSDAPASLGWIQAKQLRPQTDAPYFSFAVNNGLFYNSYMEPGVYKLNKFGGQGGIFGGTRYEFQFPAQGKGLLDFELKTPGVHYIGAFKYVTVKTGFFEQGKFDIAPADKPTEQEALSRVLKHAGSTKWHDLIMQRLNQIGGPVKVED